MRVYKTEQREIKERADVLCDKCGRSCMGCYGNFCGVMLAFSGGPDSPIFPDDERTHRYDVCEHCADEWLKGWAKDYMKWDEALPG